MKKSILLFGLALSMGFLLASCANQGGSNQGSAVGSSPTGGAGTAAEVGTGNISGAGTNIGAGGH